MPIIVSREKQADNTIRTENIHKPIVTKHVPRFLAPHDALKAIDAYTAMLSEYHAFKAEYLKTVNVGAEKSATDADKAAARKAVEAGKPVTNPTKNADAYRSKAAEYEVRHEVWLEKLVEAERLVEAELAKPGDDALIERSIEIAEERAGKYRTAISAMLEARDYYKEALHAISWAVAQSPHDPAPAVLPSGKIPPPPQASREEVDVSAILADSERHKGRLDLLVGRGNRQLIEAARRFMYKRLPDDPKNDPKDAPSGSGKDRFFSY
ncbi:hypothetical protein ACQEVF_22205 [Nonomuraea polychroma]|uniref:hypothetical protein n=1 Tax=Nonomuraea polychroma TaxID=46176 RepID=UPI003D92A829